MLLKIDESVKNLGSIRQRVGSVVKGREVSLQHVRGVVFRQTRRPYMSRTFHVEGITVQEGCFCYMGRYWAVTLTS